LVVPAFLLLVFGGIETSIAMHKGASVQWAIERAARAAALDANLTETGVQTLVDQNLKSIGSDVAVDIAYSKEVRPELTLARVTATYVHTVTPVLVPSFSLSFVTDVTIPLPQ
jgi:Flp pilus assembly protein TadG